MEDQLGVPAVALFPKLSAKLKDDEGTEALNPDTLVLRAVRAVKKAVPDLTVITDVALDPYTTHGHDGVLNTARDDVWRRSSWRGFPSMFRREIWTFAVVPGPVPTEPSGFLKMSRERQSSLSNGFS